MLVLFETPAGFALFKVLDEGKLNKVEVFLSSNLVRKSLFFFFFYVVMNCEKAP